MFNQPNYEYNEENFQRRTINGCGSCNFYTSAGFDMIDNINQRNLYGSAFPLDRVSGYTVKQLEDGLRGAKSWREWRNNIKARSNNSTENFVDELFNNWQ